MDSIPTWYLWPLGVADVPFRGHDPIMAQYLSQNMSVPVHFVTVHFWCTSPEPIHGFQPYLIQVTFRGSRWAFCGSWPSRHIMAQYLSHNTSTPVHYVTVHLQSISPELCDGFHSNLVQVILWGTRCATWGMCPYFASISGSKFL